MAIFDNKFLRIGRRKTEPHRDTATFPALLQLGQMRPGQRTVMKPTTRNLRHFSKTPYARRAINAIKNPVSMLDWEIVPIPGVSESAELKRQIEVATYCFNNPNGDDSFRSFVEQVLEDTLITAGAIETQVSGDLMRPLWMFPVDALSISMYPGWTGAPNEARYAQQVGQGAYGGGGDTIPLRDDELMYIRPNPSTATPFGLAPLEVAFLSISRQLAVGEFAGNVSANAKPSIMINLGENSDEGAALAFRSYWTSEIEGQGKTPITAMKGGKVERLFPEGDTALYLKYQDFLKAEIATAFDLSPMNLGVERDVNRNTAEVGSDRDWDSAIKPRAKDLESHFTREALNKRLGFYQLRFRFLGLDREDEKRAAEIFAIEYQNGAITPNEYRETRGRAPSESVFADLTGVDFKIASMAAQGAKDVEDPDLPQGRPLPKNTPDPKDAK